MKTETNECDEINYQEKTFTHTHAFKCLYLPHLCYLINYILILPKH